MGSLRSSEKENEYAKKREERGDTDVCALCAEVSLQEFTHWRIVENRFPYDNIAKTHHMVLPHRHVMSGDVTLEERSELEELKKTYIDQHYEFMLESTPKQSSIPAHFHLHLIVAKDFEL